MTENPATAASREAARRPDGRFGEQPRDEDTSVDLLAPAIPDGSYLFPPILRNAAETIAFWERVEVPDEVLAKVAALYVDTWEEVCDQAPEYTWEIRFQGLWEGANPAPADPAQVAAWEARREQARVEHMQALRATLEQRPAQLDPRDVRPAARVLGMIETISYLPPEEGDKVRAHSVQFVGGEMTVVDANINLGLLHIGGAVTDPATYHRETERLAEKVDDAVRSAVEQILRDNAEQEEQIIENLKTGLSIVIDTMR